MSQEPPQNLAASVRQRLLNVAQAQQEDFQNVLTRYALERCLYRLDQSEHRDRFVLKGALLFTLWGNAPHRPTRDLDLLCQGNNAITHLEQVFREICQTPVQDDGLDFKAESVRGQQIKEAQEYEGVRIKLNTFLTGTPTRIDLQVDIGFGDTVTPQAKVAQFPTILAGFPAPSLKTYPAETVIAEKFQAMAILGIANSRMKDFYDIWYLSQHFEFDGIALGQAIQATFDRRRTPLPEKLPLALSAEFSEDAAKQAQWNAFIRKAKLKAGQTSLGEVIAVLRDFLMPPVQAVRHGRRFELIWQPGGFWQPTKL
ncbi:MAG: nucleotidyl transferase AbiEii/AbiGii toxin family protein [Thermosynechococcaceae cyanobacterium]